MPPALRALILQILAAALVAAALTRLALPAWAAAAFVGALAAAGSLLWRMDRWWPLLLGLFPPAVWLALQLPLPPLAWGVGGVLLLLIYGGVYRSQVPLFLSRRAVWDVVLSQLPAPQPGVRWRMIDLGSGFGGLPRYLARQRPDVDCHGVELALLPAAFAALRQKISPLANVALRRGDLWSEPLARADLAFAFLSPVPMAALWRRVAAQLPPGALFVSCEFPVPDVAAFALRVARDGRRLYVYKIPVVR